MKPTGPQSLTQLGLIMVACMFLSLVLPRLKDAAFTTTFPLGLLAAASFMLATILAIIVVVQAVFCAIKRIADRKAVIFAALALLWLAWGGWLFLTTTAARSS